MIVSDITTNVKILATELSKVNRLLNIEFNISSLHSHYIISFHLPSFDFSLNIVVTIFSLYLLDCNKITSVGLSVHINLIQQSRNLKVIRKRISVQFISGQNFLSLRPRKSMYRSSENIKHPLKNICRSTLRGEKLAIVNMTW